MATNIEKTNLKCSNLYSSENARDFTPIIEASWVKGLMITYQLPKPQSRDTIRSKNSEKTITHSV